MTSAKKCIGCGQHHSESEVRSQWCGMTDAELRREWYAEVAAETGSVLYCMEVEEHNYRMERELERDAVLVVAERHATEHGW